MYKTFPLIPWTETEGAKKLQESARYLVAEGEGETVYVLGGFVERSLKVGDFYWKEGATFPLRLVTEARSINSDEMEPYQLIWTVPVSYPVEELPLPFTASYTDYYGDVHKMYIRKSWYEKQKKRYLVYFEDGEYQEYNWNELMRFWKA